MIPAQVINAVLYGPDVGEGVGVVAGEAFAGDVTPAAKVVSESNPTNTWT